jgi:hypothetical protein
MSKEAVSKLAFPKIVKPADLECGSLLPPSKTAHVLRAQNFTKKAQASLRTPKASPPQSKIQQYPASSYVLRRPQCEPLVFSFCRSAAQF